MQKLRLIVGLILVAGAALMFVFGKGNYSVVAIGVIGLLSIAISRRK